MSGERIIVEISVVSIEGERRLVRLTGDEIAPASSAGTWKRAGPMAARRLSARTMARRVADRLAAWAEEGK